jgi:hypothetical protein
VRYIDQNDHHINSVSNSRFSSAGGGIGDFLILFILKREKLAVMYMIFFIVIKIKEKKKVSVQEQCLLLLQLFIFLAAFLSTQTIITTERY